MDGLKVRPVIVRGVGRRYAIYLPDGTRMKRLFKTQRGAIQSKWWMKRNAEATQTAE